MRRDKGLVDRVGRTPPCPMAAHERPGCLLLADADPVSREQRGRELAQLDYHVWAASSLGEAFAIITAEQPHFAILDYKLSDGSGVSLIPRLITADPAARIVVLSCCATFQGAVTALRMGATDFLARPAETAEIDAILRKLSDECRLSGAADSSLEAVTRRHAQEILRIMTDDICATARVLGIDARTLRKLLART